MHRDEFDLPAEEPRLREWRFGKLVPGGDIRVCDGCGETTGEWEMHPCPGNANYRIEVKLSDLAESSSDTGTWEPGGFGIPLVDASTDTVPLDRAYPQDMGWVHIAVVWERGRIGLYANGSPLAEIRPAQPWWRRLWRGWMGTLLCNVRAGQEHLDVTDLAVYDDPMPTVWWRAGREKPKPKPYAGQGEWFR